MSHHFDTPTAKEDPRINVWASAVCSSKPCVDDCDRLARSSRN
jgi:hypothetical protein